MLFKLSLKNMKKSFKDYAIYFFTLILGVAVFYLFNAIESQQAMMNITSSTKELIQLMIMMLNGISVFVSFILGFLIIYASRFLMKRRNKEFGIYMTLGMSKGKISKILLIETFLIGIISLVVGLIIGISLSQFMSIFVAKMFEADMTKFTFVLSKGAILKTILYFGVMYLLVMIFNTIAINKCKLIDLIYGNKKNEQIKMKKSWLCIIIFIISAFLLGKAYYMVTADFNNLTDTGILIAIILGGIGTFLCVWSLSGLILKIVKSIKKLYMKDLNMFVLRQMSSKVNTTIFSVTMISLMLFLTICILSSALSMKNSMTANLKELTPVDIQLEKVRNVANNNTMYTTEQIKDSNLTIPETMSKLDFDIQTYLKDIVEVNLYAIDNLTLEVTLKDIIQEVKKEIPFLKTNETETLMRISDYNKIATLYGTKTYTLHDNEYIVIADYNKMINVRNKALKKKPNITINHHVLSPKYDTCQPGFIFISQSHVNDGIILVPDDIVKEDMLKKQTLVANYKGDKAKIEAKVMQLLEHPYTKKTALNLMSKIILYDTSVGLGAIVTFIGIYLGIIFLITSAALLALKELSESSDNKERYQMLRRIGVDENMLNRALFRQIGLFFLFPLMIAIVHSIFGMQFASHVLSVFEDDNLMTSVIMTAAFMIIIYGGYFFITYRCSKNIISEKE